MNELILDIIRYTLMFVAVGFVIRHAFVRKRESVARPLLVISLLIILSSFIPLIKIGGEDYSVIKFIQEGSFTFAVMLFGYLISFVLLLKRDPNLDYLSAFIYFIAFIFAWVAMFQYVPDSVINADKTRGISWVFLYIIIPMVNLIFYFSLVMVASSKGGKKRTGLGKILDDWGTLRPVLRNIANKYNLNLVEGTGWQDPVASGFINGYEVEIKSQKVLNEMGVPFPITSVSIKPKKATLPKALIKRKTSSLNPLKLFVKPTNLAYFRDFSTQPAFSNNGLVIHSAPENRTYFEQIISQIAQNIKTILNKDASSYFGFIITDKNLVVYLKPFFLSYSPHLSDIEMDKIVTTLIKFVSLIDQSK